MMTNTGGAISNTFIFTDNAALNTNTDQRHLLLMSRRHAVYASSMVMLSLNILKMKMEWILFDKHRSVKAQGGTACDWMYRDMTRAWLRRYKHVKIICPRMMFPPCVSFANRV